MRSKRLGSFSRAGVAALVLSAGWVPALSQSSDPFGVLASRRSYASSALADCSAAFVANRGQWDSEALFLASTSGVDSWIVPTGVVYDFHRHVEDAGPAQEADLGAEFERGPQPLTVGEQEWRSRLFDLREARFERLERTLRVGHVVRLAFLGTAPAQRPEGVGLQPGRFNYFIGTDRSKWATDVPRFEKAVVHNLYPGIDAVYAMDAGAPRYDLLVRPGAEPSRIRLALVGASTVRATDEGRLAFGTRFGEFEMRPPAAFQGAQPVPCRYSVGPSGIVRFELGPYDRSKPVVIDPLVSSTFLGGHESDSVQGVAIDPAGNAAVCGSTQSPSFPTSAGPYIDRVLKGRSDAFVARLNPQGWLLSSTFLGGTGKLDSAASVALDSAGNAVVVGKSDSADFPASDGAYVDRKLDGASDAFVAWLNASGWLLSATYLGGSGNADSAFDVAVDGAGNAFVCGTTVSPDFPTCGGAYIDRIRDGSSDGYVARFNRECWLLASTLLGGKGADEATRVAVDASGNAFVCGQTSSSDFPATVGAYIDSSLGGYLDAYVARLSPNCWLLSATLLGGTDQDSASGIDVDHAGNCVVCGMTSSTDFPVSSGPYIDRTHHGQVDVFVARLNPSCWLLASTYLGGSDSDHAYGVAVDAEGNAVVAGYTWSWNFPVVAPPIGGTRNGMTDAFAAGVNRSCWLLWSTLLGGSGLESASGVAVDGSNNVVLVGSTDSADFPVSDGPYIDRSLDGGYEGFVTRFSSSAPVLGRAARPDPGRSTQR